MRPSRESSHGANRALERIRSVALQFALPGDFLSAEAVESGHINTTYRVSLRPSGGPTRRVIIQSINAHVFPRPHEVMTNVETVTRHIHQRMQGGSSPLGGQTLHLLPTREGASWWEDAEGTVWRCYNHIDGCVTYHVVENPKQAYEAARAFGSFQDWVSDLDASALHETIPDFHHTPRRFQRLMAVAAADPHGRLAAVADEWAFIRSREACTGVLHRLQEAGVLPARVTHNDTKMSNVMIDAQTDQAACVIDLDTVMPGLSLYDFGDLVRSAASPSAEDEPDLSLVTLRMPVFEALVEGYLDAAHGFLDEAELDHLVESARLMALEVGIRFLTDFLEGDVYFRTRRVGQNLDRCRTQLKLVERIEAQRPAMEACLRTARTRQRKWS